ncbi:MAG: FAD-binding oxidoreductase [Pseudomonadota bacterium]
MAHTLFAAGVTRRRLLTAAAAGALVAGCEESAGGKERARLRVLVVGAGIIGASIAYFLAKGGAKVTLIDKEGPASHASRGTFAWINASWAKQPRDYHSLNQLGVSGWSVLEEDLEIPVRWSGALEWFDSPARMATLATDIAEQQAWGEPAQMLSAAEVRGREPSLAEPVAAAYSPRDGAVDPVLATQMLVKGAQKFGATVITPATLTGVTLESSRVVAGQTDLGDMPADRIVLATGAAPALPGVIAQSAVPQRTTSGVIAITRPMRPVLRHILAIPGVHMHQRTDGRVVLGEPDGPPGTQEHAARLSERPRQFPNDALAAQHGGQLLARAQAHVPALAGAQLEDTLIGWRPLPIDGHPVIGAAPARPDVYLAITHSGVTLAPAIGQLAAYEILEARAISRLAPYRPGRQFEEIVRY